MKTLLILNDPPYGTERSYNGLRLARWLLKQPEQEVRVFLMGDAAACAKAGQKVAQGFYNIGDMVYAAGKGGAQIGACGTCLDARGLTEADLVEGVHRSTMDELTAWTIWADKVITF